MNPLFQKLQEALGDGKVRQDVDMSVYATLKVGGPAEFYTDVTTEEEMITAIRTAYELNLPVHVFGGISNVVIGEAGLKGLTIRNMIVFKDIQEETDEYVILRVGSGYNMSRLAKETAQDGLAGLEYHLGLPGTVGGGVAVNSGWYAHKPDRYVGDPLYRALLVSQDGFTRTETHDYFKFRYDYSILKETHEILVWIEFKLIKADPAELIQHGQDALEHRKNTQPYGIPTSGCFFQNVDGVSAGKIIDEAGLKGYTIGGAQVSQKHANFIENTGTATSHDIAELVAYVKQRVKEHSGIELEEEIITL